MVGAGWGHFMNIFWALICGKAIKTDAHHNQCVWYLVGFVSDIVLCTFLAWAANTALRPVFQRNCGIDIGDYEGAAETKPPEDSQKGLVPAEAAQSTQPDAGCPWRMWMCQTGIWLTILTSVKAVVCIICWFCQDYFYTWLDMGFIKAGVRGNPHAQLIISVIVVPIIGDALQFAVQDTFLKQNEKKTQGFASRL